MDSDSNRKQVIVRLEPALLRLVDEARGDVSRQRWMERVLEDALGPSEVRVVAESRPEPPQPIPGQVTVDEVIERPEEPVKPYVLPKIARRQ